MKIERARFSFLRTLLVILGLFAAPCLLQAQSSEGTLVGTVTDPSDAPVANVSVDVISAQYGQPYHTVTDSVGSYRLENLQPGTYTVTFKAPGFSDLQVDNLILRGSVTTSADGKLQLGSVSKTVIVEAGAGQQIDTQSGQLGESIGKEEVENLPYASFNQATLALTLPGVVDLSPATNGLNNGVGYSVNGTRPRANNFLIDGQDDNDYGITGQAFQPSNIGAVQEFTVLTNSYGAEYGRGGGSVANYIYKSGSNGLHGQAWEVYNGSGLAAIPAQDKFNGALTNPRTDENTFGFDIGGAAVKDKLFFFGSIQWDRTRSAAVGSQFSLPTAAGVATLQALLPNPNVQLLLDSLGGLTAMQNPDGTGKNGPSCLIVSVGPCINSGLFQFIGGSVAQNDRQQYYRADWHVGQNDVLTGAYIRDDSALSPDFFANPGALPAFETQQGGPSQLFRGQWTHTFSGSTVNELRFSYTNIGFSFSPTAATAAGPLANIPEIDFGSDANYPSLGVNGAFPQGRFHKTTQVQDAVSKTVGRHTIKGGVDVTFVSVKDLVPFNSRGDISFQPDNPGADSSLGNFIDNFTGANGSITKVFGNPQVTPTFTLYAPYIQDSWRVKDNLTVSLGLRYEYWGTAGNVLQFPALNTSLGFGIPGATFPNVYSTPQQGDRNNFGPRLGVAYTPHWGRRWLGEDKTVFRAGFGVFYDGIFTNIVDNTAATSPNANGATIIGGAGRGAADASTLLANITATPSALTGVDTIASHLRNPVTYQYNLDVQRELPGKTIVTLAYVGTRGEHLYANQDFNGGTNTFDADNNLIRLNPNFGPITVRDNAGDSKYNSGQVEVERRFHTDLTLRVAYTYAKFIDDVTDVFTTTGGSSFAQNLQCQKCDYGPSALDRRHRLNIAYVWALPYSRANRFTKALTDRWQWASIASFETGVPDTAFDGLDINGDGHSGNDRPDIGNASQPVSAAGFDGSIFGFSPQGTFISVTQINSCFSGGPCTALPASDFHFVIPASGNGNVSRNSLYGPGQWYFDTNVERRFPIPIGKLENQALTFRVELFDALNHANLFTPSFGLLSPVYDQTAPTINGGRFIKLWLKYEF
jgi:hypothetical protein